MSREGCYVDENGRVSDAAFHAELLGDDLYVPPYESLKDRFSREEYERFYLGPTEQRRVELVLQRLVEAEEKIASCLELLRSSLPSPSTQLGYRLVAQRLGEAEARVGNCLGLLKDSPRFEEQAWTVEQKMALVTKIIRGKTTVAEACEAHGLSSSEVEVWVKDARAAMQKALKARPLGAREQYERELDGQRAGAEVAASRRRQVARIAASLRRSRLQSSSRGGETTRNKE